MTRPGSQQAGNRVPGCLDEGMRGLIPGLLSLVFAVCGAGAQTPQEMLNAWRGSLDPGGVVAVLRDPAGARFFASGTRSLTDNRRLDADVVFLAPGLVDGFLGILAVELGLAEPTSTLGVVFGEADRPVRGGIAEVPMTAVLSHTAGLPPVVGRGIQEGARTVTPDPWPQGLPFDPMRVLERGSSVPPGTGYAYSRIGILLAGAAAERVGGNRLGWLLGERVFAPASMTVTAFEPLFEMDVPRAPGHRGRTRALKDPMDPARDIEVHSSIRDLGWFLGYALGGPDRARRAILISTTPVAATAISSLRSGLGWHVWETPEGNRIAWAGGARHGYSAWLGFDRRRQLGVALLANQERTSDELGLALFRWLESNARARDDW